VLRALSQVSCLHSRYNRYPTVNTGSLAAFIRSFFYGGAVAAGSRFAGAQAAAMGGIAFSGAQVVAGLAAAGAGAAALAWARKWYGYNPYSRRCNLDRMYRPINKQRIRGDFDDR
jgi:hypothetical protein